MTAADLLMLTVFLAVYTCSAWLVVRVMPCQIRTPVWIRAGAWLIYAAMAFILPNLFYNDVITMAVMSLYYLLIGWLLYHKSRTGLLYQMIYCVLNYAAQVSAIMIGINLYYGTGFDDIVVSYMANVLKTAFVLLSALLTAAVIRRRMAKESKKLKIRGMILVPVFSFVLIFMYLSAGEIFFARYGYEWLILFCVLVMIINAYCLYVWYDVAANRELKHRLELMQQQANLTHQYYEEMERNYNASRKIIHDIRNHLHVLEQSAKMDEEEYFRDLHGMLNSLGLKFYSENRMLNIVLNDKLKNFPPERVECNIGGISLDFMADVDITTIFANLLDNGLEAAENEPDFWLKLRGEKIQDFTVVKASNYYKGNYLPGKSDKKGHEGLGLQNVKGAVEKYHGEMKVECADGEFTVTLVFPGK